MNHRSRISPHAQSFHILPSDAVFETLSLWIEHLLCQFAHLCTAFASFGSWLRCDVSLNFRSSSIGAHRSCLHVHSPRRGWRSPVCPWLGRWRTLLWSGASVKQASLIVVPVEPTWRWRSRHSAGRCLFADCFLAAFRILATVCTHHFAARTPS